MFPDWTAAMAPEKSIDLSVADGGVDTATEYLCVK